MNNKIMDNFQILLKQKKCSWKEREKDIDPNKQMINY